MKNRVAKTYIKSHAFPAQNVRNEDSPICSAVSRGRAYKAVVLAEEEMKAKAIEAHRATCIHYMPLKNKCHNGFDLENCTPNKCQYMQNFINKLNE